MVVEVAFEGGVGGGEGVGVGGEFGGLGERGWRGGEGWREEVEVREVLIRGVWCSESDGWRFLNLENEGR